ncbi:MAG: ribonuclease Y [Tissierellia bacterium]|nr:ribonuclease Y [Tissierellia bacterium]
MIIMVLLIGVLGGVAVGYFVRKNFTENKINRAEGLARNIILDAEREAENSKKDLIIEAKEEIHKLRDRAKEDVDRRRLELEKQEQRLQSKEDILEKKALSLENKEGKLQQRYLDLEEKETSVQNLIEERKGELERVAGLTHEEGKQLLLQELEQDLSTEAAVRIKENEQRIKDESKKTAQDVIVKAIQRIAADTVAENTVSVVHLPNDEMKGRIIGREGRNIRAIEALTGVDLIIDDTPEAVVLSSFNPIRREIARISLEKLVQDGRIHPTRIEETIAKSTEQVEEIIRESGEEAAFQAGVHGIHPELLKYLGRLKFRTSYGQNALEHAVEVSRIAGFIAQEVGANEKLAKRAGLLHDIGKSIDHEVEGPHVEIGVDLARKYKESEAVINGIEAHHGDVEFDSLESIIVQAADAISAARPGARRESIENYIRRLEQLEEIANSFEGIEKSYAIQAGREIRIIVKPDEISEAQIPVTAHNIVKEIENQMEFPGQIKVNVIRETRVVAYAK